LLVVGPFGRLLWLLPVQSLTSDRLLVEMGCTPVVCSVPVVPVMHSSSGANGTPVILLRKYPILYPSFDVSYRWLQKHCWFFLQFIVDGHLTLPTLVVVLTDGHNSAVRACPLPGVPVVATLALPLLQFIPMVILTLSVSLLLPVRCRWSPDSVDSCNSKSHRWSR
jgi:hypothetical protein